MTSAAPSAPRDLDRRALGRALSRAARASVAEVLAASVPEPAEGARRIGFTGPPGAGKSTLVGALARHRARSAGRIAVVAIDPSSPATQGAVLGDRIRMDAVVDDPRVFIRSFASRHAQDGLTDNIAEILGVLDAHGFDEILLETVGVGQTGYGVRDLVDIEILVLVPGAGDQIQAMKAGILETADIYVINKADQPGAAQIEADLRGVLALTCPPGTPLPAILRTRATAQDGIVALDAAIGAGLARAASRPRDAVRRSRMGQRVRSLLARELDEVVRDLPDACFGGTLASLHDAVLRRLCAAEGSQLRR